MKNALIGLIVILIAGGIFYTVTQRDSEELPAENEQHVQETETENEQESPAFSGIFTIDEVNSEVQWEGKRKILANEGHTGTVEISEGSFRIEEGVVTGADIVFDMTSIQGDGSGVMNHLKSPDFFNVEEFPQSAFFVDRVHENDKPLQVSGDLTIQNMTGPVELVLTEVSLEDDQLTITGTTTFDRTLWGIEFGSGKIEKFVQQLGDKIIDDMVSLEFTIVAAAE